MMGTKEGNIELVVKIEEELIVTFNPQTFFYLFEFIHQIVKTFDFSTDCEHIRIKSIDDLNDSNDDVFHYVNPSVELFKLFCEIHSVKLFLNYSDHGSSPIILSMDNLISTVTCRAYDTCVKLSIGSICGEDLIRNLDDPVFLSSTSVSESNNFFVFNLMTFSNVLSKDYHEDGLELTLNFSALLLKMDSFLLLRLEPFMTQMYSSMMSSDSNKVSNSTKNSSVVSKKVDQRRQEAMLVIDTALKTKKCLSTSLKLILSIQKIVLDIKYTVTCSHNENPGRIYIEKSEPMFHVPISGIDFQLLLRCGVNMSVALRKIEIFDNRTISQESKYSRILGPAIENDVDDENKMLKVRFVAFDGKVDKQCDVDVGNVMNYTSMDTIFDMVDIILMLLQTILDTVVPKPTSPTSLESYHNSKSLPKDEFTIDAWETISALKVCVNISQVQAILLQNTSLESSRAILLDLGKTFIDITIIT